MKIIGSDYYLSHPFLYAFYFIPPLPYGFKGRFHGLGAGVHGQDHFIAGEFAEFPEERADLVIVESPGGQGDLFCLLGKSFNYARMPVPVVQR